MSEVISMSEMQAVPRFAYLSDVQIQRIHSATLEILERTGVRVDEEEALSLLKSAGCHISDGNVVRIRPKLIERALASAPEEIIVSNRKGERSMSLGDRRCYYGTGSDLLYIIDSDTGKRRRVTKKDIEIITRLCDALPNIDFIMSMGIASDVPSETSFIHQFEAMVRNTTKPIIFTAHGTNDVSDIYKMASVVAGGEKRLQENPFIILYSEPISPLMHSRMGTEKILFCAEKNIPFVYIPAPMSGATAPVTLAGSLALGNAEVLSGLLISQLKKEGALFVYGGDISIMDMRTCIYSYGAPELQILNAALADLAHYYKLPLFCIAGATDSKLLDAQLGAEVGMSVLISTLNGANLIHDVGYMASGLASSLESIIFADEVMGMVKHMVKGFEIDNESLALDVIDEIGPGGNFLTHEHTIRHFKSAHWCPRFVDRENYEKWSQLGEPLLQDKLGRKAKEILKACEVEPLSNGKKAKLQEIINKRE